jgi:hypothetical protein
MYKACPTVWLWGIDNCNTSYPEQTRSDTKSSYEISNRSSEIISTSIYASTGLNSVWKADTFTLQ